MSKFNRFSITNHTSESLQSFDSQSFRAGEFEYQSHERANEHQLRVIGLGREAVRMALGSQLDEDKHRIDEQGPATHERQRPLDPASSHELIINNPALRELYGVQERVNNQFASETELQEATIAREYSEKIVQDLENDDPALHTLLSTMYGGESRNIVDNLAIDSSGRLLVAAYLSDKLRFSVDSESVSDQTVYANVRASLEALSGGMTPPASTMNVS